LRGPIGYQVESLALPDHAEIAAGAGLDRGKAILGAALQGQHLGRETTVAIRQHLGAAGFLAQLRAQRLGSHIPHVAEPGLVLEQRDEDQQYDQQCPHPFPETSSCPEQISPDRISPDQPRRSSSRPR
jgi:hypothetical protein